MLSNRLISNGRLRSSLFWLAWSFDCQVDVKDEGDNCDSNSPVLQLVKVGVKQEDVKDELVDHL